MLLNLLHRHYRDLEKHVEQMKRNSSSAQRPVTLRDVEDGAVTLRKVGEALATLKGERRHMIQSVKLKMIGLVINVLM